MEEKPKSIAMNGIYYGVIGAAAMIIFSLIIYLVDLHLNSSVIWISYLFLIGAIVWGTIDYRNKVLNGFMSYGKAFSTSFMIALFAVIIVSIYSFIFFQFIAPDAVVDLAEMGTDRIIEDNPDISEEDLDQAIQMSSFMYTPVWLTVRGLVAQLVVSVVISLITSIFIKKEDKSVTSI
ncbi:MAG: DUF4199 domain-containing protein [Bacteroidales bacterium]|nr:DUF4199 domain-containing protein [Bacteroidota bacterium]MBL6949256.1 DUF4199 domain-containing protein [Bacteroidales bacterium]